MPVDLGPLPPPLLVLHHDLALLDAGVVHVGLDGVLDGLVRGVERHEDGLVRLQPGVDVHEGVHGLHVRAANVDEVAAQQPPVELIDRNG